MGTPAISIGVLTSSRADFGIYLPLLRTLQKDPRFETKLIVFGTHVSRYHGNTIDDIESEGFQADFILNTTLAGDSPEAIATAMSLCSMKFAQFWGEHRSEFDIVFCLGDRYEMFAAVSAGAPFRIRFAHIHGGEKTLGSIDNFFRHSISHLAWCHFTSTDEYADRLRVMLDDTNRIFSVGSLSIDSLGQIQLAGRENLTARYGVRFDKPLVVMTFHPETIQYQHNDRHAQEICKLLLRRSDINFVLTLPNADTFGASMRQIFIKSLSELPNVWIFENLGTTSYFSFLNACDLIAGNSSSGIIEAASFGKYVINLGERQKGRLQSANIIDVPVDLNAMDTALESVLERGSYTGENRYFKGGAAEKIKHSLNTILQKNA